MGQKWAPKQYFETYRCVCDAGGSVVGRGKIMRMSVVDVVFMIVDGGKWRRWK
jgi:hypothetical protein